MNLDSIKSLQQFEDLPHEISRRSNFQGRLSINNFIAIPIADISSTISNQNEIVIKNPANQEIGYILWTKDIEEFALNQVSELVFICYLNELEDIAEYGLPYRFKSNYVIIKRGHFKEYIEKFHFTSSLWGGFVTIDQIPDDFIEYQKTIPEIRIPHEMNLSNSFLSETSMKSTASNSGADRFLKLYHLVELMFDYDTIEEIKTLNIQTDQVKIGKIFHDYQRNDIDRLVNIMSKRVTDTAGLVSKIDKVGFYLPKATIIFHDFGKSSNPIKDVTKLSAIALHPDGFSEANYNNIRPGGKDYTTFIIKLSAYWIYRIRCSIAHNKIGEYVVTNNDEEFIIEFAEPLISEVITQIFKK